MMRMTNIYRTVRRHLQWKVVPIWKTYKPEANFKYSPLVMDWIVPKKNLLCSTQIINYAKILTKIEYIKERPFSTYLPKTHFSIALPKNKTQILVTYLSDPSLFTTAAFVSLES